MPHTITATIRWREQINAFFELPKDKRPPEDIWFDAEELDDWFDRVFDNKKQTEFEFVIDEVEG